MLKPGFLRKITRNFIEILMICYNNKYLSFMATPLFITTKEGHRIRIINPFEYDSMVQSIVKPYLQTIFNIAMFTGMRWEELIRLWSHPEWVMLDRRVIELNRDAQKKVKRKNPVRLVPIVPQIENELKYFFKNQRPPTVQTWDVNLKRWAIKAGLGEDGISAKMTRASIEMWMIVAELPGDQICLRQGHNSVTSLNHYQTLKAAFTEPETYEIKKRLAGWK